MKNNGNKNQNFSAELIRLGNMGVRKAQEENRRLGIPNVYFKNGKIYYQFSDGEVTSKETKELANN